ncbi:uncharacterized protein LOC141908719 isoform X2 [Tubulanus polymorphus]
MISTAQMFGLGAQIFSGFIFDKTGPTITSAIGLILVTLGYGLVYSTFSAKVFYSQHYGLMAFYFCILAHGFSYLYTTALLTNIRNFPNRHNAKVVAVMDTMFQLSLFVFTAVYNGAYVRGHLKHEAKQDLQGYILLMWILGAVTGILSLLFFHELPPDETNDEHIRLTDNEGGIGSPVDKTGSRDVIPGSAGVIPGSPDVSPSDSSDDGEEVRVRPMHHPAEQAYTNKSTACGFLSVLGYPSYHALVWGFSIIGGLMAMFVTNIGPTLKSVHLVQYVSVIVLINTLSGLVMRVLIGPLSDYLFKRVARDVFVMFAYTMCALGFIVLVFFVRSLAAVIISNILLGSAISITYTLVPVILAEVYGNDHLGLHFGVGKMVEFIVLYVTVLIYGKVYDSHVVTSYANMTSYSNVTTSPLLPNFDCYGNDCTQLVFIVSSLLAILAAGLAALFHILLKKSK